MEEIPDRKEKKKAVQSFIESLKANIERYSIDAEESGDLSLFTKANSFWKTGKGEKLVLSLDEALENLEKDIST